MTTKYYLISQFQNPMQRRMMLMRYTHFTEKQAYAHAENISSGGGNR